MATAADLLTVMEALDNELRAQSGEADEARALTALTVSQYLFEDVAAKHRGILGTHGTVTATANTETTAFPAELIRLDSLWMIADSLPSYELDPIYDTGGHRPNGSGPLSLLSGGAGPGPTGYFTNASTIFWRPIPDVNYTIRWYGLQRAAPFTTRAVTFAYTASVQLPLASFAVKLLSLSVGDDASELDSLAQQAFSPTIAMLKRQVRRMKGMGRVYRHTHST